MKDFKNEVFDVEIELSERMLGTVPKDPDVYRQFVTLRSL